VPWGRETAGRASYWLESSVAEVLKRQTAQPIIALCQMRRCRTGSWFEHGGERGNGKGMFTKR
jgi:hypothetical protein